MDTKFQTSFIPKQPVTELKRAVHPGMNILYLLLLVAFIGSIVIAGGLFLYDKKIDADIQTGKAQLDSNQNAFDSTTIKTIIRLNDRINAVSTLVKQHISPTNLFTTLQATTLQTVRFTNFTFTYDPSGKINVAMGGVAASYESVALQARAFTDPSLQGVFESPLFTNLNLDASGNVTFTFTMQVDPTLLSYYKSVKDNVALGQAAQSGPGVQSAQDLQSTDSTGQDQQPVTDGSNQ